MLRNLNPILSPDLLYILASMGHGDEIVIADANFPSDSSTDRLVRLDGVAAPDVVEAVLSIMPLDNFVDDPARSMQIVGKPDEIPPVVQEYQEIINKTADFPAQIKTVERFAFYEEAKKAYAIVQTGELRIYGNLILKKGVVAPS
ncbi:MULTISPECIES: RbsD/FucU family protein [Halocynthiibacter]|uniref:Ribose ABC transporter n=1 Tax=Halocynthiibacter halioticoli TaxID=2986804 RepID=A0AAE3J073_9RHOB|nr:MULTISPECIES: RbsD/FucU domain-containing protein [Halocynthiibacter]MCV6825348.1 ribose ABC transporter [Halocynthiibacter halioticoli]MCW4058349.1 ribose ABC transporter [Halocynthiibacter sp. SDUM655004]